jgi:hypothetical protein
VCVRAPPVLYRFDDCPVKRAGAAGRVYKDAVAFVRSGMSSKVDQLIAEFAVALRKAIADEAAQAFAAVASGGGAGSVGNGARAKRGPKPSAAAQVRRKRTADDIEKQANTILHFLKKKPGQGAEQIGAALGITTAEMSLPIKFLIASKAIKHVGEKRGRKYTAK